jgi:hypothetical protein
MVRYRTVAPRYWIIPSAPCAKELTVDRQYDLFEVGPDGSPLWREAVIGQENAMHKLKELASKTTNEIRVMDLRTSAVIATANNSQ